MAVILFRNEGATLKKSIFAIILVVAVVLAFLLGMLVNKGNQCDNSQTSVVGVYKTDSWNGKTGTLVLYEDGSCQYPSGGDAKWVLDGSVVRITLESRGTIADGTLQEVVNTSEHEAKIMENGLVLHGQFFEKVSN